MKGLTLRQGNVLEYMKEFIAESKYPPTIREIAEHFEISVKGSYDHVKALEKKGYIRCHENRSRAIEILVDGDEGEEEILEIPVLGNVAAGRPLFAEENFEGVLKLPSAYLGSGKHFALNVRGDSMKDAGILDGDTAIIAYQNTAQNGDIVVAMVDDAVALKRFFLEKNRVRLKSENPDYPSLYTRSVRVLGKLRSIIRRYE